MQYEVQKFEDRLIGTRGFSDMLLTRHFSLYEGYVKNVNILLEKQEVMLREEKYGSLEQNELRRRLGWEFNGMRLHELYFWNINKFPTPIASDAPLNQVIDAQFGNWFAWQKDFIAIASMRGIGWTILYKDMLNGRLFNVWINEHDVGHFAGCNPLLVLDVFEHAYIMDYGLKRSEYIEAFLHAIDWSIVEERFKMPASLPQLQ